MNKKCPQSNRSFEELKKSFPYGTEHIKTLIELQKMICGFCKSDRHSNSCKYT